MVGADIIEVVAKGLYIGGYASFLFIPYWMCLYFSNEKKKKQVQ